jgi:hypothetical protein
MSERIFAWRKEEAEQHRYRHIFTQQAKLCMAPAHLLSELNKHATYIRGKNTAEEESFSPKLITE